MTKISIIIPVLNEQETISYLLEYLLAHAHPNHISEIIVVDGGSTDGTQESISKFITERKSERLQGFKSQINLFLINSAKGRAKQMNHGARNAHGAILYFLHADSFPPKNFDQLIIRAVNNGSKAGCFRLQFDSKHWWLRLASWLTRFNWRACRGGDQSQFITKELFNEIGGYNEHYIIYEDNILINALYARNEFTVINKKVRTSARLYKKHGIWKTQYHFWMIYAKRWFGASPEDLFRYYQKAFK